MSVRRRASVWIVAAALAASSVTVINTPATAAPGDFGSGFEAGAAQPPGPTRRTT